MVYIVPVQYRLDAHAYNIWRSTWKCLFFPHCTECNLLFYWKRWRKDNHLPLRHRKDGSWFTLSNIHHQCWTSILRLRSHRPYILFWNYPWVLFPTGLVIRVYQLLDTLFYSLDSSNVYLLPLVFINFSKNIPKLKQFWYYGILLSTYFWNLSWFFFDWFLLCHILQNLSTNSN